jgi:hypothetical protein
MKKVTAARERQIREHLFRLVDNRLIEVGVASMYDYQRKFPNRGLFDPPLCPFFNRLCPDDLCYLPANHVGTEEGFHITGTCSYDYAVKWAFGDDLAPVGTSRRKLIEMGARLAYQEEVAARMGEEYRDTMQEPIVLTDEDEQKVADLLHRELSDSEEAAEEATWD